MANPNRYIPLLCPHAVSINSPSIQYQHKSTIIGCSLNPNINEYSMEFRSHWTLHLQVFAFSSCGSPKEQTHLETQDIKPSYIPRTSIPNIAWRYWLCQQISSPFITSGTKTQKSKSIPDTADIFVADTLKGGAKKPELAKVGGVMRNVFWLVDLVGLVYNRCFNWLQNIQTYLNLEMNKEVCILPGKDQDW